MKLSWLVEQGRVQVDPDILERWGEYQCYLDGRGYYQLAIYVNNQQTFKTLHKLIMPGESMVDHKDRDIHNCLRANLRYATPAQSSSNRLQSNNTSGYIGVKLLPSGKYLASIQHNYKRHSAGTFNTAKEAAEAYNLIALRLKGEFAVLNLF